MVLLMDPARGSKLDQNFIVSSLLCFRSLTDVQLVDLFSTEFNLKVGDSFSKTASNAKPPLESVTKTIEAATNDDDDDDNDNYDSKLRSIVAECMDRETIQQ